MTYLEDLIRLRDNEVSALRSKVEELEAKLEVLQNDILWQKQEK